MTCQSPKLLIFLAFVKASSVTFGNTSLIKRYKPEKFHISSIRPADVSLFRLKQFHLLRNPTRTIFIFIKHH